MNDNQQVVIPLNVFQAVCGYLEGQPYKSVNGLLTALSQGKTLEAVIAEKTVVAEEE